MGVRTGSEEDILWENVLLGTQKEENQDTEEEEGERERARKWAWTRRCLGAEAKREEFQRVKGQRYQVPYRRWG